MSYQSAEYFKEISHSEVSSAKNETFFLKVSNNRTVSCPTHCKVATQPLSHYFPQVCMWHSKAEKQGLERGRERIKGEKKTEYGPCGEQERASWWVRRRQMIKKRWAFLREMRQRRRTWRRASIQEVLIGSVFVCDCFIIIKLPMCLLGLSMNGRLMNDWL